MAKITLTWNSNDEIPQTKRQHYPNPWDLRIKQPLLHSHRAPYGRLLTRQNPEKTPTNSVRNHPYSKINPPRPLRNAHIRVDA